MHQSISIGIDDDEDCESTGDDDSSNLQPSTDPTYYQTTDSYQYPTTDSYYYRTTDSYNYQDSSTNDYSSTAPCPSHCLKSFCPMVNSTTTLLTLTYCILPDEPRCYYWTDDTSYISTGQCWNDNDQQCYGPNSCSMNAPCSYVHTVYSPTGSSDNSGVVCDVI
jgi:hypothetical protein